MTKMGAAGVRIELIDNSAYSVIENPNAIAGVVGFSPKGELNKIITLTNTGEQDTYLGYGYNNYKYNQGMYAARAVLNAGGHVEFVRPYGEEIDKTDPYKRDLKTDAFVVAFDKSAALYEDKTRTSFNVEHFAATRYKTDGAAEYGVTRKINNISETIAEGTNVKFSIDGADDFKDSKKCRKYSQKKAPTDMVLFSVMNADPTAAMRAYASYEVISVDNSALAKSGTIDVTLSSNPVFIEGDTLHVPSEADNSIAVHSAPITCQVTKIVDTKVTITWDINNGNQGPSVLIYCDAENAVADGYDYLNVKTAVAGRGVKTLSALWLGSTTGTPAGVKQGTLLGLKDINGDVAYVRFANTENGDATGNLTQSELDPDLADIAIADADLFIVAHDIVNVVVGSDTYTAEVLTTGSTGISVKFINLGGRTFTETTEVTVQISEFSDEITSVACDISSASTWGDVSDAIILALKDSTFDYGYDVVLSDINGVSVADAHVINVDPSAAYDYSVGDTVAVVVGASTTTYDVYDGAVPPSVDPGIPSASATSNVVLLTTIAAINPIAGVITLDDELPSSVIDSTDKSKLVYAVQLLDLTNSMYSVYAAKETVYKVEHTNDPYKTATGNVVTVTGGTYVVDADKVTEITLSAAVDVGTKLTLELPGDANKDENGWQKTVQVTLGNKIGEGTNRYALVAPITDALAKGILDDDNNVKALNIVVRDVKDPVVSSERVNFYLISSYSLYVSSTDQKNSPFMLNTETKKFISVNKTGDRGVVVEQSAKVLADSSIGSTFLGLGLASTAYADVNYIGDTQQVYALNAEGEMIARMFLSVNYMFNGTLYEFEGTVVPYVHNDTQLFIGDAADAELTGSGARFVMNDTGELDIFLENNSYDLSQSIVDGRVNGSVTKIAFNDSDPAILNNAVWSYSPINNRSASTLSTVWNLFLDKDNSDVSFLVAAGCAINNLFMRNIETLNTQVIQAMLNVCELRKDCFALFDGVGEAKTETALKKDIAATGFGSTLGRWGAIYDGRGIVFDSIYTKGNIEVVKSIQMASLITANRAGGIWWNVPAGQTKGVVPSAWGTREKYPRRFSYPEDPSSDIAKFSNIHVNPTRSNSDGMFIWGDFTMQMEDTAFNQIHVAMLMAGVHKQFYKYLDSKVFRLNTSVLRSTITADLQAQLNQIMTQNPSGFYEAVVICNDTNNTAEIIDQNKLIVDLKVKPTKSTRYIYLRSEVLSTSSGNNITTSLV